MGRFLVVANQTLGGEALDRTIRDRIQRADGQFFIVVPMTSPKHETDDWARGFPVGEEGVQRSHAQVTEDARRREAMRDEARRRAERRLGQMIEKIRSAGGEADGQVGDADPVVAVKNVLQSQTFDEVIVSTLPTGISRWLKMDLPSRASRMTTAPVTTIQADE